MEWNEHVHGPIIIQMSQWTTQEDTQESIIMPYGGKRKRSDSYGGGKFLGKKRKMSSYIPRSIGIPKDNRCTIPLTITRSFDLTADIASLFEFDARNLHILGTQAGSYAVPGAAEVAAVWDLMRVAKVEMTILPAANVLAYNDQTLSSGQTNIPYVYHAFDPVGNVAPTLSSIQQLSTFRSASLAKGIKRTFYPRLEGSNGIVDVGINRKNLFEKSTSESTQKWRGISLLVDLQNEVWTYGSFRVLFKVYYECMMSK